MASLIISYFTSIDGQSLGIPLGSEVIETSPASAAASAVPNGAMFASVRADVAHYVAFGDGTPTASLATGFYLPANETVYLRTFVAAGQTKKIAAVTA